MAKYIATGYAINNVIIRTSNILCKMNYHTHTYYRFPTAYNMYINYPSQHIIIVIKLDFTATYWIQTTVLYLIYIIYICTAMVHKSVFIPLLNKGWQSA